MTKFHTFALSESEEICNIVLLKIASHLKCVATLPYEMSVS